MYIQYCNCYSRNLGAKYIECHWMSQYVQNNTQWIHDVTY